MNKHAKMVNRANKVKLYNSIMESVLPEIRKALNEAEEDTVNTEETDIEEGGITEGELNELFGFGSSVKKPEVAVSLENTDEENAEICLQWFAYYVDKIGTNVVKVSTEMMKEMGKVIMKSPMFLAKAVLLLLTKSAKGIGLSVQAIATLVMIMISILARAIIMSVQGAKEALTYLYKKLSKGLTDFYAFMCKKADSGEDKFLDSIETVTEWVGVSAGVLMAVANKIEGAAEAFGNFISKVFEDAKKGVKAAVMIAKTWLSAKSKAVLEWITSNANAAREEIVKKWNELDKSIRKKYNSAVEKLEEWMNDIADLAKFIATKASDAAKATKDFTIDAKDKALIWGIQKGVKGLSDKYTEDQVVALVRKCYNESLVLRPNGSYLINECYFHEAGSKQRMLREARINKTHK